MFGTVWPATKLRLDAVGRGCPVGHAVRKLDVDGSVAVTFKATDPTPVAGTPPRPVTTTFSSPPAPIAPIAAYRPSTLVPMPSAATTPVDITDTRVSPATEHPINHFLRTRPPPTPRPAATSPGT